ncbi:MAG: hypothetical protein MZU95_04195 [Desulfomicrobium escambiense]|nr:hypothetical protein [Desulfomicrobium escambiense]
MDKDMTKNILKAHNLPIIPSFTIYNANDINPNDLKLNYPLMVKPVSEGSSYGMSKVNSPEELEKAIAEADKYNTGVMIEEFIIGKSLTVGVLDLEDKTFATPILQLETKIGWYDFESKYTHGMTEFILPAKIQADITEKIQEISVKTHKAVNAKGIEQSGFCVMRKVKHTLCFRN